MHKAAIFILASCILASGSCTFNEKQHTSSKSEKHPEGDSALLSLKGSKNQKKGEYTVEYRVDSTYSKYGKIEGRVIDIATGEPLPFANIEIIGAEGGAVTDLKGKYHLTIPPGVYGVRPRMMGYKSLTAESILVETGRITIIDFMLAVEIVEIKGNM